MIASVRHLNRITWPEHLPKLQGTLCVSGDLADPFERVRESEKAVLSHETYQNLRIVES